MRHESDDKSDELHLYLQLQEEVSTVHSCQLSPPAPGAWRGTPPAVTNEDVRWKKHRNTFSSNVCSLL